MIFKQKGSSGTGGRGSVLKWKLLREELERNPLMEGT